MIFVVIVIIIGGIVFVDFFIFIIDVIAVDVIVVVAATFTIFLLLYPAIKCECTFLNLYYSTSNRSILLSDISFN